MAQAVLLANALFSSLPRSQRRTAAKLEQMVLDNSGITVYVNDLNTPHGSCPETHQFAYQNGTKCCSGRVAGISEPLWEDFQVFLSLTSLTCEGFSTNR